MRIYQLCRHEKQSKLLAQGKYCKKCRKQWVFFSHIWIETFFYTKH